MDKDIRASDVIRIIPNPTLYYFGVLTLNVHMARICVICGCMGMNYRYSNETVYHLVDKYMHQPRLMKLNMINMDENHLSSDIVSIALPCLLLESAAFKPEICHLTLLD
jgi:hypothetical protein